MSKKGTITIGDICISIEGDDFRIWPAYRPFVASGNTDITLRLYRGYPSFPLGAKIFDCSPIWALHRHNGRSVIRIFEGGEFPGLERILVLSRQEQRADLYFPSDSDARSIDPFYGPVMELLVVNHLAEGKGVILHACGIDIDGKGILFVGESRAGKSTLARLWGKEKGVEVLSDDRTIIRRKKDRYWMYGTPWHGDAKFASPRGVRLRRIFFVRPGRRNIMVEIKGIDPVSRLLTCSFPPHWDSDGMTSTLELFADLTSNVPCQELAFTPDRGVLDLVKRVSK